MIMTRTIAFFVLLQYATSVSLLWAAPQNSVDKVVFTNGDTLTGTLSAVTPDHVSFMSPVIGALTLKWQDIQSVEMSPDLWNQVVKDRQFDQATVAKMIHRGAGNALVVASAPSSPASSDANIVSHWSGLLSSQNSVTRATQSQYQIGGSLHVAFETIAQKAFEHQIISLDSNAAFGEASKPNASPVRTALFTGTLSYNLFLTDSALQQNYPSPYDSFYFLTIADGYHNLSLAIDEQQSYGLGFGWLRTVKAKPNENGDQLAQVFGVQADVRYSHQQLYAPGGDANLLGTGIRESYSISIPWFFGAKSKPINVSESILTIPYLNDPHWLQVRGVASLAIPLTKDQRLQIGPKIMNDYFRNSPPGSKQNYLQTSLSLSYCFNPIAACH